MQILKVVKSLGGSDAKVTMEDFVKTPFWFDESEKSQDRTYSHPFPRLHQIKELLFKTNATSDNQYLDMEQFIGFLKTATARKEASDFNGLLFAPVKTLQQ